ncbi:Uncharacterised protein [uncultured Eubacterium sp.]|jgi:dihydrofolate reductase|nr:Uncharacterised protein [uncultured Eubacterium sp.]
MMNIFNILNILNTIILHIVTYSIITSTWPLINNIDSLPQRINIIII